MEIGTPALLFGAIALIMLAYTNRFFLLAKLIRDLHAHRTGEHPDVEAQQVPNLRLRLKLIKWMQATGVFSFLLCTLAMFSIFVQQPNAGRVAFGGSVVALMGSLVLSLWEVLISTRALDIVLDSVEQEERHAIHAPHAWSYSDNE